MNNWLDLSDNANTFLSTIVDGFVDTSGGNIIVRENQHLEVSGDASFNQGGSFAVPTLKTDVLDTTGLVNIELSKKTEFVENPSFIQFAYDISGAESGGLTGKSISKNLAGDIIAVGAPLNSGGGTARGEVRVYQKDNDSWLQLGSDLNGEADNDEFGHSVDLNGDGTILAVGTKDISHNTLVYKYDSGSWGLYGNNIYQNVNIGVYKTSILTKPKLNKTGDKLSILQQYNEIIFESMTLTTTFSGNIEIKGSLFTGGTMYGDTVALSYDGNTMLTGGRKNSDTVYNEGSIEVYTWNGTSWTPKGDFIYGGVNNGLLGRDAGLNGDGNIFCVGQQNTEGFYVYEWSGTSWGQKGSTLSKQYWGCDINYSGNRFIASERGNTIVNVWEYNDTTNIWDDITSNLNSLSAITSIGQNTSVTINKSSDSSIDGTVVSTCQDKNTKVFYYNGSTWSQRGSTITTSYDSGQDVKQHSLNHDGTLVAIGCNENVNSVEVYEWNGTSWGKKGQTITTSDITNGSPNTQRFGLSVSLSSNGSYLAVSGGGVFEYNGSAWVQVSNTFGNQMSSSNSNEDKIQISGDGSTIVIGLEQAAETAVYTYENISSETILVEKNNGINGIVQSYQYSESDASWNYLGDKIESVSVNDISGGDIAINDEGNMIAVGYPQSKSSIQGTYSYSVINGTDTDANNLYEFFGEEFSSDTGKPVLTFKRGSTYNLSINSTSSHPFYIQTTENGGIYDSANVYNNGITNNGVYNDTITFVVPSDAPDTLYYVCQYHGNMGNSISIVNESGNDGRTKVFKYDTTDSSWNQVGNNIDGEGQAGTAVVIDGSGDFVAIGSPFAGDASAGEVNVYQNVADTWTLHGNKIQGQADNDQFGTSIDMTPAGNILAVGAPNANAGKGNVNIYQYNTTDTSWNKINVDLSGDAVGDLTGTSVKLNQLGTEVSVGEPNNKTELSFSSDITLNWDFARDATGVTTIGDAGTTIGTIYGNNNTLTESEGFVGSGSGYISSGNVNFVETSDFYTFPSDQFTMELYLKPTATQTYLVYYRGSSWNPGAFGTHFNYNSTRIFIFPEVASSPTYSAIQFSDNSQEIGVWKHYVYVCDMSPSGGGNPQISLYIDNTLIETLTFNNNYWSTANTSAKLGILGNSTQSSSAYANIKKFKVINKLLNASEISELYSSSITGPLTLGRVRTFEIEHTKFYNGMTNPTFGIGVTNPTNRLDVDGTVYIDGKLKTTNLSQTSGTTTVSGDLTLNGSISVSSVNNSSLTYDTDMSVNLLKRLFVNPNDISSYGETTQTHASDVVDTSVPGYYSQFGSDILGEGGTTGTADDQLGESIAISGNGEVLFVGAYQNDETGSNEGKVYVYRHNGTDWALDSTITDPNDTSVMSLYLGRQVATNYYGTRVLVGCSGYSTSTGTYNDGYYNGIFKVFEQSTPGGSWNKIGNDFNQGTIRYQFHGTAPLGMNHNTDSSIDGKYVITGGYRKASDGSVPWRAYEYDGSDWIQRGTDPIRDDSTGYHYLGVSQKINNDGTVIIVGNTYTNNAQYGSIHAYEWNGSDWQPKGSVIEYPYSDSGADFAEYVAINGDGTIIATSAAESNEYAVLYGAVFVYQFINGDWVQLGNDIYGKTFYEKPGLYGLSLNNAGNRIVFGAIQNDDAGDDAGCIRIYEYVGNDWKQIGDDFLGPISANNESDVNFGYSVSMSYDGSKVAASAPSYHGLANSDTGLIRVFNYNSAVTSQTFSEDLSFNHSLVVPGNLVIVDGSNNTNYGSYTTYTSTDVDNYAATPTNKSYHVGKSKSNVFNIVNQDNIGVYMNTGDTSFTSTSDERLKHKIQHTENSLEKICALQPRKFKWKYNDKPESGFIAQEIEKVFPEIVDENNLPDGKTIKGVNHSSLLPYILDSLQSLDKEINDLIEE